MVKGLLQRIASMHDGEVESIALFFCVQASLESSDSSSVDLSEGEQP